MRLLFCADVWVRGYDSRDAGSGPMWVSVHSLGHSGVCVEGALPADSRPGLLQPVDCIGLER